MTFQNTSTKNKTNTYTITHNLNSNYIIINISNNYKTLNKYNSTDFININFNLITNTYNINSIRLHFTTTNPPTNNSTFKITIIK